MQSGHAAWHTEGAARSRSRNAMLNNAYRLLRSLTGTLRYRNIKHLNIARVTCLKPPCSDEQLLELVHRVHPAAYEHASQPVQQCTHKSIASSMVLALSNALVNRLWCCGVYEAVRTLHALQTM
eukprot:5177-Heterococcus_DN1.PRE.2